MEELILPEFQNRCLAKIAETVSYILLKLTLSFNMCTLLMTLRKVSKLKVFLYPGIITVGSHLFAVDADPGNIVKVIVIKI